MRHNARGAIPHYLEDRLVLLSSSTASHAGPLHDLASVLSAHRTLLNHSQDAWYACHSQEGSRLPRACPVSRACSCWSGQALPCSPPEASRWGSPCDSCPRSPGSRPTWRCPAVGNWPSAPRYWRLRQPSSAPQRRARRVSSAAGTPAGSSLAAAVPLTTETRSSGERERTWPSERR